ncbi:MAG TPA: hypothetical protein VD793_06315, partial [Gemmatimonadales bacterium]|nr:hypothetical protein [Gemmatimonadales bacterium]
MNLFNVAPPEAQRTLQAWLEQRGEARYRIRQVLPRLWGKPIPAWASAPELPRVLAAELDRQFPVPRLTRERVQISQDGTTKYLWRLPDG